MYDPVIPVDIFYHSWGAMSAQTDHSNEAAHPDAARAADLSELLGHINTSWDNERRALSRQLHDSLGSSLTALTMHLGLLMQKMPQEPALQDRAAHMKTLLMQIVETNRRVRGRAEMVAVNAPVYAPWMI